MKAIKILFENNRVIVMFDEVAIATYEFKTMFASNVCFFILGYVTRILKSTLEHENEIAKLLSEIAVELKY